MQMEQIDTFLDLVETHSFNRTAERLGVTQSTVSARLVALEEAVGARLFTRSRAGTQMTTEGLKFEPHARLLRQDWTQARRAVAPQGTAALSLRFGIQNDLMIPHLGELLAQFRKLLPQTAFYIEPDYSTQMCADLVTGVLDFAVMFTPKPHPDLLFTNAGELGYLLISSKNQSRAMLDPERYITANFSPAFETAHRQLLPELSAAPLAVGQSTAIATLLAALGGAGYVQETQAREMVASGDFFFVSDAPVISQPVYAALHLRNRISKVHRQMLRVVQNRFERREN
jgi:LysR family transcriptional regulator, flagellar master operon regulator